MSIETNVLDIIREQLSRRQPVDGGSRNVIRTMTATCGYAEVRSLAAQRLEMWLQNPKVFTTIFLMTSLVHLCASCEDLQRPEFRTLYANSVCLFSI